MPPKSAKAKRISTQRSCQETYARYPVKRCIPMYCFGRDGKMRARLSNGKCPKYGKPRTKKVRANMNNFLRTIEEVVNFDNAETSENLIPIIKDTSLQSEKKLVDAITEVVKDSGETQPVRKAKTAAKIILNKYKNLKSKKRRKNTV